MSIKQYAKFITEQLRANQHSTLRSGEVIMENADHKELNDNAKEMYEAGKESMSMSDDDLTTDKYGSKIVSNEDGTSYAGKHSDGNYSYTNLSDEDDFDDSFEEMPKFKDIHDIVRKQNPHLQHSHAHAKAKMIHKDIKDNCGDGG